MTVSNTVSSVSFVGNSATTVFPYAFLIPTNDDAEVVVYDSTTFTETVLAVGVDCTISGVGDPAGGNVTYAPAIAATKTITIRRKLDLTQSLNIERQSNYNPSLLEDALDRIVMMVQQINTKVDEESLTIPAGSGIDLDTLIADIAQAAVDASAASASAIAAAVSAADAAASAATVTPLATQIGAATDTAFADADFLVARKTADGSLIKRSWANTKTALQTVFALLFAAQTQIPVFTNFSIAASVAANALTVALKGVDGNDPSANNPVYIPFRNVTAGTGTPSYLTITGALSLVISSGSTMGFASGVIGRLWLVIFNDGGTARLGLVNCRSGVNIMPLRPGIASSTAEGGAGGADSAQVIYTGTAVTSKAMTVLGYLEATEATAGTWATAPSLVKLWQPGDPLPGDTLQVARNDTGAVATGSTALPADDTIPQNTEGDQFLSQAITPLGAPNLLGIIAALALSNGTSPRVVAALFRDSTANALAVQRAVQDTSARPTFCTLNWMEFAGSTSSTTIKARGGSDAGTTTFNGAGGGRLYGGVYNSFLEVREIMA